MKLIEDRLKEVGTNSNIGRILVTTIDGFQGLERETVILSLGEFCNINLSGFLVIFETYQNFLCISMT